MNIKQCYECKEGFYLDIDKTCKSCQEIHQNCTSCEDQDKCLKCERQKLSQNTCVDNCPATEQDKQKSGICESCSKVIENCEECSEDGTICYKCFQPFIISKKFSSLQNKDQDAKTQNITQEIDA